MYKPTKLYDELKVDPFKPILIQRGKSLLTHSLLQLRSLCLCMVSHRKGKETFVSEDSDDDDEFLESIIDNKENLKKESNRSQNYQIFLPTEGSMLKFLNT